MKKIFIVLAILLLAPYLYSYETTIENRTPRLIEVKLVYPGLCGKKHQFLVKAGETKTQDHGVCCLLAIKYIVRSGPRAGKEAKWEEGRPIPTRLLPWKSCKKNHFIIREIPEDNSLFLEDTAIKKETGYPLYIENNASTKIRVKIFYATTPCTEQEKIINKGRALFMNTGKVRAGVYLGKAAPVKTICCVKKIQVSPIGGEQRGRWFDFEPGRKLDIFQYGARIYGGHCGTLKLEVKENPDASLFVQESI